MLVEAGSGSTLQPVSESAGLHTLAETAALKVPATSHPRTSMSLIQQPQQMFITSAPNVLATSQGEDCLKQSISRNNLQLKILCNNAFRMSGGSTLTVVIFDKL